MSEASPLSGLRVIELGHTVMGPTAGLLLADLGAEVLRIEPCPDADPTRRLGGFAAGFFPALNRNKRSLLLDLKRPEGQAVLHRLVPGTDILLENYAPGAIDRLGCGWDALHALNPRLILLSLKGYLAGPYEHRPALDEVVQFHTGLAYMTGPPGQPARAGASVIDILGAVLGVTGALAALHERERTGLGTRVGGALFESAAMLMGTHMAGAAAAGEPPPPMPARHRAWAIYQVFATLDGAQIFVGVTTDAQWRRFAAALDLHDLAADPALATNAGRIAATARVLPRVAAALAALSLPEASALCERAAVSFAPVGRPQDLAADPHLLAGGLVETIVETLAARAGTGPSVRALLPALPLEFGASRARAPLRLQPPAPGEGGRAALLDAGLAADELDALEAAGILHAT